MSGAQSSTATTSVCMTSSTQVEFGKTFPHSSSTSSLSKLLTSVANTTTTSSAPRAFLPSRSDAAKLEELMEHWDDADVPPATPTGSEKSQHTTTTGRRSKKRKRSVLDDLPHLTLPMTSPRNRTTSSSSNGGGATPSEKNVLLCQLLSRSSSASVTSSPSPFTFSTSVAMSTGNACDAYSTPQTKLPKVSQSDLKQQHKLSQLGHRGDVTRARHSSEQWGGPMASQNSVSPANPHSIATADPYQTASISDLLNAPSSDVRMSPRLPRVHSVGQLCHPVPSSHVHSLHPSHLSRPPSVASSRGTGSVVARSSDPTLAQMIETASDLQAELLQRNVLTSPSTDALVASCGVDNSFLEFTESDLSDLDGLINGSDVIGKVDDAVSIKKIEEELIKGLPASFTNPAPLTTRIPIPSPNLQTSPPSPFPTPSSIAASNAFSTSRAAYEPAAGACSRHFSFFWQLSLVLLNCPVCVLARLFTLGKNQLSILPNTANLSMFCSLV